MHITTGYNKIDCTSTNNNSNLQNHTQTHTHITNFISSAKHQKHFTNTKDFETTTKTEKQHTKASMSTITPYYTQAHHCNYGYACQRPIQSIHQKRLNFKGNGSYIHSFMYANLHKSKLFHYFPSRSF